MSEYARTETCGHYWWIQPCTLRLLPSLWSLSRNPQSSTPSWTKGGSSARVPVKVDGLGAMHAMPPLYTDSGYERTPEAATKVSLPSWRCFRLADHLWGPLRRASCFLATRSRTEEIAPPGRSPDRNPALPAQEEAVEEGSHLPPLGCKATRGACGTRPRSPLPQARDWKLGRVDGRITHKALAGREPRA